MEIVLVELHLFMVTAVICKKS